MQCEECGENGATSVEVIFQDGAEKEIPLCEDCRESYRDGDLVEAVESEQSSRN